MRIAGIVDAEGRPLHIGPRQLRQTYATALINAGISVPALRHLFGATVRQRYETTLSAAKSQDSSAMLEIAAAASKGEPDMS